jgi:hypothetical protein
MDSYAGEAVDPPASKKHKSETTASYGHDLRRKLSRPCLCSQSSVKKRPSCFQHFLKDGWNTLITFREHWAALHKLDQDRAA